MSHIIGHILYYEHTHILYYEHTHILYYEVRTHTYFDIQSTNWGVDLQQKQKPPKSILKQIKHNFLMFVKRLIQTIAES